MTFGFRTDGVSRFACSPRADEFSLPLVSFITSLSTLGTFGVLLIAKNPVIAVLGYTVTLACLIAAPYALFLKLPREVEPASAEANASAPADASSGQGENP